MPNSASIDANRREVWTREVWQDVQDNLYFVQNGMMNMTGTKGKSKEERAVEKMNGIVAYMDDLEKGKGDTVTMPFTAKLGQNTGVTGDNELEGNESEIVPFSESIAIDQFRDAVRLKGRLDEQKNAYEMRPDARDKLAIRFREFLEKQIILKLCSVTNPDLTDVNGAVYSGTFVDATNVHAWSNIPTAIPNADYAAGTGNRYICANTGGGDGLTAADLMTPELITRAKVKAELASPTIESCMHKGKPYYLMMVHPWTMADLRANAAFAQAMREAWWRGEDNPLFSGADLVWDNVIIHSHKYMPFLDTAVAGDSFTENAGSGEDFAVDTFRSVLCGKRAVGFAKCENGPKWSEKDFDHGNKWSIAGGLLGGVDKVMFNSKEYGVITIDHAATAL